MDLGNTFGIPYFQTDAESNPINAGEVNEYGLQAAYSFLGVSNQAYVVRANLDTSQLIGSANIPAGAPVAGTYWLDTSTTSWGIFQWNASPASATNGQSFVNQAPLVITNTAQVTADNDLVGSGYKPLPSIGSVGQYAIVAVTTLIKTWYKQASTVSDGTGGSTAGTSNAGTWVEVGSTAWAASSPTVVGNVSGSTILTSDTLVVNGYTVTGVSTYGAIAAAITTHFSASGITAAVQNGYLNIYSTGTVVTMSGSAFVKLFNYSNTAGVAYTAGSFYAPSLTISPHYTVPQYGVYANASTQVSSQYIVNGYPTGSLWVKTTPVNQGANWDIELYNGTTASWVRQSVTSLYQNAVSAMAALDPVGGGINIPVGTVFVKYNDDDGTPALANFKIYQRESTGTTSATSQPIGNSTYTNTTANYYTFAVSSTQPGSATLPAYVTVSFTAVTGAGTAMTNAQAIVTAINAATAGLGNVVATVTGTTTAPTITITSTTGGDISIQDGTGTPIATIFSTADTNFQQSSDGVSTHWKISAWYSTFGGSAVVTPSATAPTTTPANGTLWYDSNVENWDIMINDGTYWRGYLTTQAKAINQAVGGGTTDPNGPIVSALAPTVQSGGAALANGDLWIDTSNLEQFPAIYKFNYLTKQWALVNNTDHTTQNGILYADARWSDQSALTGSQTGLGAPDTIVSLLGSSFVDADAPNAELYPKGMILVNTRRSDFNVKEYQTGFVNTLNGYNYNLPGTPLMSSYYPDRWVSAAPNDYEGVGVFGRKAQRAVVVKALNALIESNQNIRNEDSLVFDLLSCPGYLETLPALVDLNNDRGLLSFIVADTPARLTPDATSLSNWGNNVNNAPADGEQGLITTDANSAVYYPWGYTTDLLGNNIVVPPSHIMLRTIALSDNVSYPWFAPAGVRRGGVTNVSSVGYVDGQTGEFVPTSLNTGQRDTLASIQVNPITYIGGVGLVTYGQYTRQLVASSLNRINVARLVIYLRYQLNAIAKPYVFEPNDTITRNEIKNQINALMLNLTGERALYDYLVVCDTSNNTPSRIDANELYVDIAIEPVKSVEFIYIPLRLENTGAIKGLSS
jgi:hypothetical protein